MKASIAGAIVTNTLFMLGMSFLLGGLRHHVQEYNRTNARLQAGLLFLATVALLVPSTVTSGDPEVDRTFLPTLSVGLSVLLMAAYALGLLCADVVTRMTREFKAEGFTLDIDEGVLDHIVADALRKETGARGLAASLTRQLEDVAFESFGSEPTTAGIPPTVRVRVLSGSLDVSLS